MKIIRQIYNIHSPLAKVWNALTDAKIIDAWGGGPAKMDNKVESKFSLWGGSIWGKNTKVIKEKELVQEWFSDSENKKWEKPSIAIFKLIKVDEDNTRIDFMHENVPDADTKDIEEGWRDYYLGSLKEYLEK